MKSKLPNCLRVNIDCISRKMVLGGGGGGARGIILMIISHHWLRLRCQWQAIISSYVVQNLQYFFIMPHNKFWVGMIMLCFHGYWPFVRNPLDSLSLTNKIWYAAVLFSLLLASIIRMPVIWCTMMLIWHNYNVKLIILFIDFCDIFNYNLPVAF